MYQNLSQIILEDYFLSEKTLRIFTAVLVALAAYLVFYRFVRYWLLGVLRDTVSQKAKSLARERQIKGWILFFERIGGAVILFSLLLFVLSELNFNVTPILTGAGILGLAVGLGSQAVIKDIIGGIFILLEGQYNEGDRVKIAGLDGKVEKISLRRTTLRSKDGKKLHIIPNGEVKAVTVYSEK